MKKLPKSPVQSCCNLRRSLLAVPSGCCTYVRTALGSPAVCGWRRMRRRNERSRVLHNSYCWRLFCNEQLLLAPFDCCTDVSNARARPAMCRCRRMRRRRRRNERSRLLRYCYCCSSGNQQLVMSARPRTSVKQPDHGTFVSRRVAPAIEGMMQVTNASDFISSVHSQIATRDAQVSEQSNGHIDVAQVRHSSCTPDAPHHFAHELV